MIEQEHREAYWKDTRTNAIIAIVLLLAAVLLVGLFIGFFRNMHFLGFPLAYYLAAQGGFILLIIMVFWFSSRQEKIDRRHGASEEL